MPAPYAYTLDVLNDEHLDRPPKAQAPRRCRLGRTTRKSVPSPSGRRFTTAVVGVALSSAMLAPMAAANASPVPTRISLTGSALATAGALQGGGSSWWQQLLSESKDLGPSRSRTASILLDLEGTEDRQAVETWARDRSLRSYWYASAQAIELTGTPKALGRAFDVKIDDYIAPDGQRFYAATRQPWTPRQLARAVTGVGRLTNYRGISSAWVGRNGLLPADLLQAYDATPLRSAGMDGAGETVVAFEIDNYGLTDLNHFAQQFGLPTFNSSNFVVNGGEAQPKAGPGDETDMDLETIREIAPAAKIVYYNIFQGNGSGSDVILNAFTNAAKEYPHSVWSLSIGSCEKAFTYADLAAENKAAAAAVNNGTTIFAASGDTAGFECVPQPKWGSTPSKADVGVWTPAVLPAVTGVGGTNLSIATNGDYLGETVWYYPVLGQGSSGGVSTLFAQPSYQTGGGLPAPSDKVPREVPDVSAVGDPITGNAIYEGGWTQGGGTSLATPIWAGFTALMDEYLHKHNKPPVGFLNAYLYYFFNHAPQYPPLHAVDVGGNNVWRNGSGYNQSTGLGSPDVYNLARDILAQEGK